MKLLVQCICYHDPLFPEALIDLHGDLLLTSEKKVWFILTIYTQLLHTLMPINLCYI